MPCQRFLKCLVSILRCFVYGIAVGFQLQVLIEHIMARCGPAFGEMTRVAWANIQDVGDSSPYVSHIKTVLEVSAAACWLVVVCWSLGCSGTVWALLRFQLFIITRSADVQAEVPLIRSILSALFFDNFCDRFASTFLPAFMNNIFKYVAQTQSMPKDSHYGIIV